MLGCWNTGIKDNAWILDREKKKALVLTSIQEPASSICSSLLGQKHYFRIYITKEGRGL
jgi:hypothetical protein